MNTMESYNALIVTKNPAIQEDLNDTIQNASAGLKCESPEDFQKKILHNCLDTSVRWSKAFESLRDKRLNAPQKTIMKGIISDIFSITNQEERKKYIDQELGTHLFTVAAKRGSLKTKRTIYELDFKDKSIENFDLNNAVLGHMGSSDDGFGNFSRGTIGNWSTGSIPQDRNRVIRLAFWAKYTVEETDKLLECAGMHKLYLKGTGSSNLKAKNSLQDLVYIFMLRHKDYSFAKAQKTIRELDCLLENAEKKVTADGDRKEITMKETTTMLQELEQLEFCHTDFISYFKSYLPALLDSYHTLYGYLIDGFITKYNVCRGNSGIGMANSISIFTTSRLKCPEIPELKPELKKRGNRTNESDEWRESLINTLYAAFLTDKKASSNQTDEEENKERKNKASSSQTDKEKNKEKNKEKKNGKVMERVFNRNDIIILGLILNSSMKEINESLLTFAQEPPLYGKNFMENIIRKASSDPACEVRTAVIASKFTTEYKNYYGITKDEFTAALNSFMRFYNNREKTIGNSDRTKYEDELVYFGDVINTLRSLKKYEWIKSISVVKEIYPKRTYDFLSFKPLTETDRKKLNEKLADIDGSVISPKPDPETEGQQNLFVIHVLRKEAEADNKSGEDKKSEGETNSEKEKMTEEDNKKQKYRTTTIYLKKIQVVRPSAYYQSEKLLSWYPERVIFDFLVYKTAVYLKEEKYRNYLLPEDRCRFTKGE